MNTLNIPSEKELNSKNYWYFIGPAFLVSVGYMDPGNWATSIEAGSRFGYQLLWIVTVASAIAILMQVLCAKLGIVTGKNLAEMIVIRYKKRSANFLLTTAAIAMIATDLAEFLGVAVALNLLFDIPLIVAVVLTIFDVLFILWLERYGFRWVEMTIIAFVATIGLGYVIELWIAQPAVNEVITGLFVPNSTIFNLTDTTALFIAMGILGATVMPHNLYLHSNQVITRTKNKANSISQNLKERIFKISMMDTVCALILAWMVNASILILASAVFFEEGLLITDIDEAYKTLGPLLGKAAALTFAIALLASGIASSVTGTMAGQIVFEAMYRRPVSAAKVRLTIRLITMLPAAAAILLSTKPLTLLVLSQVILSMQLPFAIVPLIIFTSSSELMGVFINSKFTIYLSWICAAIIIALNIFLLILLIF